MENVTVEFTDGTRFDVQVPTEDEIAELDAWVYAQIGKLPQSFYDAVEGKFD